MFIVLYVKPQLTQIAEIKQIAGGVVSDNTRERVHVRVPII